MRGNRVYIGLLGLGWRNIDSIYTQFYQRTSINLV